MTFAEVIECMVLYKSSVEARHAELVKQSRQLREILDKNEENEVFDHEIENKYWDLENKLGEASEEQWETTKVLNLLRDVANRNLTAGDSAEIVRVFGKHM